MESEREVPASSSLQALTRRWTKLRARIAFCLVVAIGCAIFGGAAYAQSDSDSDGDTSSWKAYADNVGAFLYKLAWPTATYQSVSFGGVSFKPNGADVKLRLHGISAFDDGPLWTDLVLEVRDGKISDLHWGENNAQLAAPGSTMKALGSALAQLNDEYNREHPAGAGDAGPAAAAPDGSGNADQYVAPAAPDQLAAVCINNPTTTSLVYTLQVGSSREDHTIAARQQLLTSGRVSAPVFTITFDDSFADGYTGHSVQLPAETFTDTPTTCDEAMTYDFVVDGQSLGLAPRKWTPGFENPFWPNVVGAAEDGKWACVAGMKWASSDPNTLDCVPSDVGLVGLSIVQENGVQYPKITAVSPSSAAEKAGISAGVYLLSVDGVSLDGMSLNDVVAKLRGPVNTAVKIAVSSPGDAPPRVLQLQRQ